MSCSKYRWTKDCDTGPCPGDCDRCFRNLEEKEEPSDLIRRGAVKDTIAVMCQRCDTRNMMDYRNLLIEAVDDMPPANPEPCGDLISREAAIEVLNKLARDNFTLRDYFSYYLGALHDVSDGIKALPSAQPEQRWIPCDKRVPSSDEWVIVTILDESGDTPWRYTDFGWYLDRAKCWIVDAEQRTDVIAWMPLPRAYKGGENG